MPSPAHRAYVPTGSEDDPDFGRMILRDGTVAQVRIATPADHDALTAFFESLSPESRRRRFFTGTAPRADQVASLCVNGEPRFCLTLLVTRTQGGAAHIIATGSYLARNARTAEIAFAVDDAFQGKGLGTLLLERLAGLAVRHGFTHFWAVTHSDNQAMRQVFQESGYALEERSDHGECEFELTIVPNDTTEARLETRHRIATVASLRPFFHPRAVAVVGASCDPASIGYRLLDALVSGEFPGRVYPVHPRAAEVHGLRAYPSVRALPEAPDLAVVAVPREAVLGVVDDCAARGVRALVVITAGFAEVGGEGKELQRQLAERVRGHGMRLLGPNCLGLLSNDPAARLNATFIPVLLPHGSVAMSSDSGAVGLAVLAATARLGLGVTSCVSVGNRADVSSNDLLEYWEGDDTTGVILLYLESFGNPRRFARIARRVSRRKPIVAVKAGRTRAGFRAAGSHTAALAVRDVAVDALFRQTGVLRAESLAELLDLAAALACQPLPAGRRVGILTNAGGPAILCADASEAAGLALPELSAPLQRQLGAFLPATASLGNPVDMIASATPEQYGQALRVLLASGEVDAVVVMYVTAGVAATEAYFQALEESTAAAGGTRGCGRPVLACLMPEPDGLRLIGAGPVRIPCHAYPEAPARVLGKLAAYAEWRAQPLGRIPVLTDLSIPLAHAVCRGVLEQRGNGWLSAEEVRHVLEALRLPLSPGGVARTAAEAVTLARRLGFPVALKLASHRLVHKTERGGVHLNLADEAAVQRAFEAIHERLARDNLLDALEGVVVQPMVAGGTEVMVGMTHDPLFGPLMAFGLGGIHVEVLGDVCFRVSPLTDRDAAAMVRGIRGYQLLEGYRGHPPADVPALEDVLLRVARLAEDVPEITELELNPIFALPPGQGCRIVDARVRVEAGQP